MEDLFGLIVWIVIIAASISNKKKKKQQAAQKQARQAEKHPWEEAFSQVPGQAAEVIRTLTQAAQTPPTAPAQTALPPLVPDMPPAVLTPLAPTVHTHLEPECETHDAAGSLNYVSTEGIDACHEEQFESRTELIPQMEERPGLALDFTGDNLVRAFVMQEVLTRPCDRRPRGYAR